MNDDSNIIGPKLSYELFLRQYRMSKGNIREIFKDISLSEYLTLYTVFENADRESYGGKTYLQDLTDKLQLTIRQTSKMVGDLRDKGLIIWSHDGNGQDGTYVTITDTGRKLIEEKDRAFRDFTGRVTERFGKENMITLLCLIKELETIMSSEIEEYRGGRTGNDIIE